MRTPLRAAVAAGLAALAGCSLTIDPNSVKPPGEAPGATAPAISLDQATLGFTMTAGGAAPAAKTVHASNSGGGTLAIPTAPVTYTGGNAAAWNAANASLQVQVSGASAPFAIQVQVLPGTLAAGTYTARIAVTAAGATNSPQNVDVTLTVNASPPHILLSATSRTFNATAGSGVNPAAQQVLVSNDGGGTLASPTTSISYGQGSGWLSVGAATGAAGGPYTLPVSVTLGALTQGTYGATVSVASVGASNTPQTFTVTFTVGSASQPTMSITTLSAFQAVAGGSDPAQQALTITNAGSGTLALPTASVAYDQVQTGWLTVGAASGPAGGPFTMSVSAAVGALAAGTYTATVNVTSTGASPATVGVPVTFTVQAPPTFAQPGALTFAATEGAANPTAQNLVITNTGGGTLAAPTTGVSYLSGSNWLTVGAPTGAAGGPYTISVQPITAGVTPSLTPYQATIAVTSANAVPATRNVTVSFTVTPLPVMNPSTASMSFSGTAGSAVAGQNLTITNTGGPTLTLPVPTVTAGGSWLSCAAGTGGSNGPFSYAVSVNTGGLTPGTYNGQLSFASVGARNTPLLVNVTLNLAAAAQPILGVGPTPLTFNARQGTGTNPPDQALTAQNLGTGTLLSPSVVTTTTSGGSWLSVIGPTGAAGGPYTITVKAALGSLVAGSYSGTVTVASAGATGSPAIIPITFNVNAPSLGGCVASGAHKVCEAELSAGGESNGVPVSGAHRIKQGIVAAGGSTAGTPQSGAHKIARGAVSPGANP